MFKIIKKTLFSKHLWQSFIILFPLFISLSAIALAIAQPPKPHINPGFKKSYGSAVVIAIAGVCDGDTFGAIVKEWPAIAGDSIWIQLSNADAPSILSLWTCAGPRQLLQSNAGSLLMVLKVKINEHGLFRKL